MNAQTNRFSKLGTGAAGLILLLVVIGAVVTIIGNLRLRRDLTADKLYTLSDGSRAVLGKLPNDVALKFYFNRSSQAVPMFIKSYARQVEDLLKEYAIASRGRLVLEIHDPKPDSDEEEWAQRYGIQGQPTGVMTPPLYFGIVAVSGDREEALPALSPQSEATLEYDLTRLITRVATTVKPVVGVMSSLPVMGEPPMMAPNMMRPTPPKPWYVIQELQRDFEVRVVDTAATSIDPEITTLLVVHPKAWSPRTLYAIDQFVMRGGRLIACVDPLSAHEMENQQQNQMAMMGMGGGPTSSTLGELFDAWGVGFDPQKLLADMRAMTRLGGAGRIEESPVFLSLGASNMNKADLLTAQLDQVMMPFAGVRSDATGDDVTFEPLVSSSDAACRVDAQMAMFGTEAMRSQLKPDGLRHVIAARLSGTFKTAFPDGAPTGGTDGDTADEPPAADPAEHLAACAEPTAMLVIADTDFLADRFAVREVEMMFGFKTLQAINDNLAFLANAVEKLSGSADLIAIRSRGASRRPFVKVDELEFKAMTAWRAEEERLAAELQRTQQQLAELQNRKQGSQKFILSPEQEEAISRFQQKQVDVKAQLKQVRRNLSRDIERLGIWIKVLNIVAVPAGVILLGVVFGLRRRRLH